MKVLLFLCALLLIGACVNAQSIAEPLKKPTAAAKPGMRTNAIIFGDTLTPGTNFKGFRLQGAGALYGVTLKPFTVSTSAVAVVYGIGWENDTWDAAKQRFYQKIGISLLGGPGGQLSSPTTNPATGQTISQSPGIVGIAAIVVSTQLIGKLELPFKLVLGFAYNTATGKGMAVTGPINGLNN
jgi:hypothetical protein